METKKETVTAWFPGGIGTVEISKERAEQIKRLQKIIKERPAKEIENQKMN